MRDLVKTIEEEIGGRLTQFRLVFDRSQYCLVDNKNKKVSKNKNRELLAKHSPGLAEKIAALSAMNHNEITAKNIMNLIGTKSYLNVILKSFEIEERNKKCLLTRNQAMKMLAAVEYESWPTSAELSNKYGGSPNLINVLIRNGEIEAKLYSKKYRISPFGERQYARHVQKSHSLSKVIIRRGIVYFGLGTASKMVAEKAFGSKCRNLHEKSDRILKQFYHELGKRKEVGENSLFIYENDSYYISITSIDQLCDVCGITTVDPTARIITRKNDIYVPLFFVAGEAARKLTKTESRVRELTNKKIRLFTHILEKEPSFLSKYKKLIPKGADFFEENGFYVNMQLFDFLTELVTSYEIETYLGHVRRTIYNWMGHGKGQKVRIPMVKLSGKEHTLLSVVYQQVQGDLEKKCKALQKANQALSHSMELTGEKLERAKSTISKFEPKIKVYKDKTGSNKASIRRLEQQYSRLETKAKEAGTNYNELERRTRGYKREISTLERRLGKAQQINTALRKAHNQLKRESARDQKSYEATIDKLTDQLTDLTEKNQAYEAERKQYEKIVQQPQSQVTAPRLTESYITNLRVGELRKQITALTQKNTTYKRQAEQDRLRIKELEAKVVACETDQPTQEESRERIIQLTQQIAKLTKQNKEQQTQFEAKENELTQKLVELQEAYSLQTELVEKLSYEVTGFQKIYTDDANKYLRNLVNAASTLDMAIDKGKVPRKDNIKELLLSYLREAIPLQAVNVLEDSRYWPALEAKGIINKRLELIKEWTEKYLGGDKRYAKNIGLFWSHVSDTIKERVK